MWSLLLLLIAGADAVDNARYLRPATKAFEPECEVVLKKTKSGTTIESTTHRGKTKMTVTARYDDKDVLTTAETILFSGEQKKTARVTVTAGKAKVEREGQPALELDVPAGVIVTSAPDWTDTWLLCRRYDRTKTGKQEFPGLWIHPTDKCQRLTFAIERRGADTIEHDGKKQSLDRFTIWLRGNSSYAAWADAKGNMIKLVPLPYNENARNWLVLDGYEKSTAELRP
ncbi:MAG: hypothetical protein HY289_09030 [Planctomycetes bacterium]|nr:hypothetical protein [Planctomycetota bacterium]